ncbi:MAG: hypothetical protein Q7T59_00920, partial [Candidatus Woesebacteria bacterium]|nr:hypothetical protein [Candidatus Woesebacteria bacterium]
EQVFHRMAGLKPKEGEEAINLDGLYSLFPTYESTDKLGRMEKEALDTFSSGLRNLGADEKVIQEVVKDEVRVQFFAVLAQSYIFNQEASHRGQ